MSCESNTPGSTRLAAENNFVLLLSDNSKYHSHLDISRFDLKSPNLIAIKWHTVDWGQSDCYDMIAFDLYIMVVNIYIDINIVI